MDMATLANVPRRLEVGGVTLLISALTQHEWATFQRWLEEFVPAPEPPEGADAIERSVYANAWPPGIASREWFSALDHPGCFARFVQIAAGKHSLPGMSDEDALAMAYMIVEGGKVADLVMVCLGGRPIDPKKMKPPDPHAFAKLPENDSPGEAYFHLAKLFPGWTNDDIMRLTFPQMRYYRSGGKPLDTGTRRYNNVAEARAARANAHTKGPVTDGG